MAAKSGTAVRIVACMLLFQCCTSFQIYTANGTVGSQLTEEEQLDADDVASLVYIDHDLVESMGARCMDGSPGGFYWRPSLSGVNASKLVLFLQGGGECRTIEECTLWNGGSGRSSAFWPAQRRLGDDVLSADPGINPDFYDWTKVFLPYCSADMHSGTLKAPSEALGGFHFSGHNLILASLAQLRRLLPAFAPTHVLVGGASAGGIGALLHADVFAAEWPRATVKAAPACGFFYAGVSSRRDWADGIDTPVDDLGFAREWQPWYSERCASKPGSNMSTCTDAHFALSSIATPLFVRENLFDRAKLANCGLDVEGALSVTDAAYLRQWGKWMLLQLSLVQADPRNGYFAPSCLEHGANLALGTAPSIGGVSMAAALRSWFFDTAEAPTRLTDRCGELPCTRAWPGQCPHLPSSPLPPSCLERLETLCPGQMGTLAPCDDCVRENRRDIIRHGCPRNGRPVFRWYCGSNHTSVRRHVCDLSTRHAMTAPRSLEW
mmetsp:Transcript_23053/g.50456  ORF Transcript_23053/g.50456 Transcript_23053/m.50456 type:complete len:493 (-) Transcript_23053:358-1836(-)